MENLVWHPPWCSATCTVTSGDPASIHMSRVHTISPIGHEPVRVVAFVSGPNLPAGVPATVLVEAYDDTDDPYAVLVLSLRQADGLADGLRELVDAARPVRGVSPSRG